MRSQDLTIADVEKAVGMPASKWHGQCFFIASQIVDKNLVKGRAAYGHYRGPVSKEGYWKDRVGQGFQRHGWVELPDQTILDPTRWSFENKPPYIYLHECGNHDVVCRTCDMVPEEHGTHLDACLDFAPQRCDYDRGGEELRAAMLRPPPPYHHVTRGDVYEVRRSRHMNLRVKASTLAYMKGLLGGTPHITWTQLHWIANLPLKMLGPQAKEIFRAIVRADCGSLIPCDNREAVLGREK